MDSGKLAIIGHPIGHSLSPLLHNAAFDVLGLKWTYVAIDVPPEHLRQSVKRFEDEGYAGFNVTIPHKQHVMDHLTDVDPLAAACGAVNTVIFKGGKRFGTNTDVFGIRSSLEAFTELLSGAECLVLGAGGAARACAYTLVNNLGVSAVHIAARDRTQAEKILLDLGVKGSTVGFESAMLAELVRSSLIVVNTTPLGMAPHTEFSPLPAGIHLSPGQIAFDCVYRPLETAFLVDARSRGATTIGGLEMLLHQGAASFRLWTGIEMPLDHVRKIIEKELRKHG